MIGMLYPLTPVILHGGSPWMILIAVAFAVIVICRYRDVLFK